MKGILKIKWWVQFMLLLLPFFCNAQLLFYQNIYNGGISVDGRSYYGDLTYPSPDSIPFQNTVPAGSSIKKAYLFSIRFPWFVGLTPQNEGPLQVKFNNHMLTIDSSDIVTHSFNCDNSTPSGVNWMVVKDVTAYTQFTNNTLITPCQNCFGRDTIAHYVYDGFLLVILYENSSMPPVNAAIFLNNKTYLTSLTYTFNNLNPINTAHDVGLAVWVNDVPDFNSFWPIDFILNTSLGTFNLDSVYAPYHAQNENTLPGSFYYQNNTLYGLVDDSPNTTFDSTDALANIKSYLSNNSTNFTINTTEITYAACKDILQSFIYAYSSPCPVRGVKDSTITYNVCKGSSTIQLAVSSSTVNTTYSWYAADSSLNHYNIPNPIASATATTNYVVLVDSAGCKHTEHVKVNVFNLPMNNATVASDSCGEKKGAIAAGHVTGNLGPYTYSIGGAFQSDSVFTNLAANTYTFITTNNVGCQYKQIVYVNYINPAHASISSNVHTGYAPFTTNITNYSTGSTSYVWYVDGNTYNTQNLSYTFNTVGTYTIMMVAEYDNNPQCKDTAYQLIFVEGDSISITVPNVFSPNADGVNDTWHVLVYYFNYTISNYDCTIYDRWGIKVFETNNINTAWDSKTTSGIPASAGTYFYIIKLTTTNSKGVSEQKDSKGYLELVR